MHISNWLLYLTNNQKESKHEVEFDVVFLILNTVALVLGSYLFWKYGEPQWIPVLGIEYMWAIDNLRHNRP